MNKSSTSERVNSATRALAILEAFTIEQPHLGLSEMARLLALPKSTTLRLLKTMADVGYVVQNEDSHWRLGPATASLAARYQISFDIRAEVEPALRKLSDSTGQDVSFFVQDGDRRVRLLRVMYPTAEHSASRVGESMPMNRGAAGKVMLAAIGKAGAEFDKIRRQGFHVTVGEAKATSASIAVPVFGSRWRLVGAVCIGAPAASDVVQTLTALAPPLRRAAESLSAALSYGDDSRSRRIEIARSKWHP